MTPEPGSVRYFVLLYAPRASRRSLTRLLALADEIGAGVARGLDHELAHARLAWWQHEAGQYALGRAQHPLLRAPADEDPGVPSMDMTSLLQAAAIDLAQQHQQPPGGEQLRRAVFAQAALLLGAGPLSPAQREGLAALAALSWQSEHAPAAATARAAALGDALARLGPSLQPKLTPLLLWAALAARRAAPGKPSAGRDFADNVWAWNLARRAAAGRFTSR